MRVASKSGAQFDYFQNADGSFTRRISQSRINYQDSAGNWQPIDTSLGKAADGRWQEKANSFQVSFAAATGAPTGQPQPSAPTAAPTSSASPSARTASYTTSGAVLPWQTGHVVPAADVTGAGTSSTGPLATLQISSSESVSWTLQGASDVTAQVNGSTSEYDSILPDTNLVLQSTTGGVKEKLVLASASAPTTWVFPMTLTGGLSLATASDGTIELVDGTGVVVATLPKAYAYDAYVDPVSGEHHENWGVTYSVTQVNGGPAITMTLDPTWLSGSSIRFPVTVDPTMNVSTSGQNDTTYVEYPYSQDFSSDSVMKVGTYDGGAHIGAGLIKLPGLPNTDGYHITGATFWVFDIWAATCGSTTSYSINPIAASWSVTGSKSWSNMPATAAAIGTWSGTPSSAVCSNSSLNSTTGDWQGTTLSTSYFQNIALGQTQNNGLAITASGTDSTGWKQFDSDNVSGDAPHVDITYSPDVLPDIQHTYPASGYTSSTLTPELQAQATDPDAWPNSGTMTFDFQVFDSTGNTTIADSGWQSSADWTVPTGKLAWSTIYLWRVSANDGWSGGTTTSPGNALTTEVAQPLVSSQLAQNTGHGYDEGIGNYTTSATDASVTTVGPKLDVTRDYNSLDTRTSGAFGAGWSALADMGVAPDNDGSGGVVVTGADGRQQRFGYNSSELNQIASVGDQTGDGVDDAVAVDQTTGKLWLYQGPDYSALTRMLVGTGGWNSMASLAGGDVNGDGIGDLIGVNTADGSLRMYPGKAGGGFGSPITIGTGGWNAMADLTVTKPLGTDGKKDLVAVETSTGSLWAYPIANNGTLGTRIQIGTGGWNGMTELMGGDFNGDGHGDVVAIDTSTGNLRLYPGTGSGTLGSPVQIGSYWSGMRDLTAVKGISGDGTTDFLATNTTSGVRYLYHSGASYTSSSWGGTTKTTSGMAVYTPGSGTFATFGPLAGASGGWQLLDTSGTTYTFGQAVGATWKVTKITDRYGRGETFSYNGSNQLSRVQDTISGRGLTYSWFTPTNAANPHVQTVTTDDAIAGNAATASLWTYSYTGDQLTGVCPPAENAPSTASTSCYAYTYSGGSDYPTAVLDANPGSYWRLNDASGSTRAASGVLANEQNDAGTYSNIALGTDAGPLAGSSAKAAKFNGTSSYMALPRTLALAAGNQSISLWFKTSTYGVLFSYQDVSISNATDSSDYTPALYVGQDGKLNAQFWTSTGIKPIVSSGSVFGGWHHVVLSGAGTNQSLYLDGAQVGSLSGQITPFTRSTTTYLYVGAGFWGGGWPDEPHTSSNTGYPDYFNGDISDVAVYNQPLTATQASALDTIGTTKAAFLTKTVSPAGHTQAQVGYDTNISRVTSVTDEHGGTYTLGTPTVAGSSAVYHSAVLSTNPTGYWQLDDQAGSTNAADEVNYDDGTHNNTTLGVAGPFTAGDSAAPTAAQFDGSSSYVNLPSGLSTNDSTQALSLWFKTTTSGILFSYQTSDLTTSTMTGNYAPSLYVGTDGHLYGEFWNSSGVAPIKSSGTVTDGKWHQAILNANGTTQTLYLDGASAGSVNGTVTSYTSQSTTYVYVGAGFWGGIWPAQPHYSATGSTAYSDYFNGSIAEVAFNQTALSSAQISTEWNAYKQAGGTIATETVNVTDPNNKTLSSSFDLSDGGRILSDTDATGGTTYYGYDTGGFLNTVTDPNGNVTTTGHDTRGNIVSRTTCQDRSANKCSTSYYTYYLNTASAADPRNDELLTSSDGRSASSTDTTYQTTYAYDTSGNKLTVTGPPVGAQTFKTTNTYTTSTTPGYASGTTAPAGLLASTTTPGGAVTSYVYYADGDLAQVTDPRGLVTTYTYDNLGRVLTRTAQASMASLTGGTVNGSSTSTTALTTSYTYDPFDRVLTQTDPPVTDTVNQAVTHTKQTTYGYDADGNTLSVAVADTTGGDATRTTNNMYNSLGELQQVTDPMGYQTSYTYDSFGNLATKTMPRGQVYSYGYDPAGRLQSTTLTNYTGSTSTAQAPVTQLLDNRVYDPAGRLSTDTNAIGVTRTYAYYDDGLTKQVTDTGSQGTSFIDEQDAYDPAGNLTSQTTKNGTLTTNKVVDAENRVTTATVDPSGVNATTAYTYDADNHVLTSTETDTAGDPKQQWTYTYYTDGDKKTAAQYVDANTTLTTSWTYDNRGHALTMLDPRNSTTNYAYNEAGQPAATSLPTITVTDPADGTTSSVAPTTLNGYDTFGERTEAEDARGYITTTLFDADGRKSKTTLPAYTPHGSSTAILATTQWTYDQDNNTTKVIDGNTNETDYSYDQLNDQVSKTNPAITINGTPTQGTWTYSYNLAGQKLTATDPFGAVAHTTYDDLGRNNGNWEYAFLSSTATSTTQVQTSNTYNSAGEVASQSSITGVTASYTYDNLGRTLTQADTTGDTTHYAYDLRDDVTKTTLPDSSIRTATYDAAGRKTATADENPAGQALRSTSATYDGNGDLLTTTNALQVTKTFGYDAVGDLTSQSEPTTSTHSVATSYGYDAAGDQTAYVNGNGRVTYYTYTPWGLPESKQIPSATTSTYSYWTAADRTTWNAYDAVGHTISTTLPGGTTLAYTYDALGDTTGESGAGADAPTQNRSFLYDLNQNLVYSAAGTTTENYDHNSLGAVLDTYGQAGTSSFSYNQDGALVGRTDASGTTSYAYDTDGRLNTAADPLTATTLTYAYNSLSQPKTITYGTGGNTRTFGYDALHRLASDTLTTPSNTTVASINYTFDNADQLQAKTTTGFAGAGTNNYGYDLAGRLTSWTNTPSGGTASTTSYTYDDNGNRLTAGSQSFSYDNRDELVSDGTNTYSYTARGTLTGKTFTATNSTQAYAFDAYGQQITAGPTTYGYDALGRNTTAGSTTLSYSGTDNTIASDGVSTYSRNADGTLLAQNTTGQGASLDWTDLHTDVVGQFTATGTSLTGSAAYDPWGTVTNSTTLAGTLGYQSEYTDPTTSQVNMHARWYQPANGAFNTTDTQDNAPIGTSANANHYAYANDTPTTGTDPSGHQFGDGGGGGGGAGLALGSGLSASGGGGLAGVIAAGGALVAGFGYDDYQRWQDGQPTDDGGSSSSGAAAAAGGLAGLLPAATCTPMGLTNPCAFVGGGGGGGGGGNPVCWSCLAAARAAAAAALAAAIRAEAIKLTAAIGKMILAVHSVIAAGQPGSRLNGKSINPTIVKNSAWALASGLTTALACAIFGNDCRIDSQDKGCLKDGAGFVNYNPVDMGNGGRATGVQACLNSAYLKGHPGSGVDDQIRPPGYYWAGRTAGWLGAGLASRVINNCHLLGGQLGGDGENLANLVTCSRDANAETSGNVHNMKSFEGIVRAYVDSGMIVSYNVTPYYQGGRTVPYKIVMTYTAWDPDGVLINADSEPIWNTVRGRKGPVNLGTVVDSRTGQPVPLAGVS